MAQSAKQVSCNYDDLNLAPGNPWDRMGASLWEVLETYCNGNDLGTLKISLVRPNPREIMNSFF